MGIPGRAESGGDRRKDQVVVLAQCFHTGVCWAASEKVEAGDPFPAVADPFLRRLVHDALLRLNGHI